MRFDYLRFITTKLQRPEIASNRFADGKSRTSAENQILQYTKNIIATTEIIIKQLKIHNIKQKFKKSNCLPDDGYV